MFILSKLKVILPTLGDFTNGVFATLVAVLITGTEVLWWHFLVAFIFSLLPDIDALPEVFRYGQVGKRHEDGKFAPDHRSYLHYPLVYLLISFFVLVWDFFFGLLFLLSITLHFVRDICGTGWGVSLLWPLSNKHIKFSFKESSDLIQQSKKVGPFVLWEPEHLPGIIEKHGQEDWIEQTYLKFTRISMIEYTSFLIAVCLAVFVLLY